MRTLLRTAACALALLATGCELTEIVTPEGRDLLVVEGVLRAGNVRQNLLLHRSIVGSIVRGEPGARVVIVTPQGEVTLEESPLELCAENLASLLEQELEVLATCYSGQLHVRPGESYELHVTTSDGLSVRGRTTVPGSFAFRQPGIPHAATCRLPPGVNMPVVWSPSEGAWAYISTLAMSGIKQAFAGLEVPDYLELTGVSVSQSDTSIILPRNFGLFDRFDAGVDQTVLRALQDGFPPGIRAEVIVAATDRNYVNAVRGGNFNPSGAVRVSSVVGDGVGVFGSVVVRRFGVDVAATGAMLPPCNPP
jgi:hypothetical protein